MGNDKSARVANSRLWGRNAPIVLIFVLGALCIGYGFAPWRFRPGLTLSTDELQMMVGSSDTARGKFRVTNNSFKFVRLARQSGCRCVDLEFGTTDLKPFESTVVDLVVDANSVKLGAWNVAAIKVNGQENGLSLRFLAYLGDSK